MAKSKSKKGQLKRYETPTDRYLIVSDPWGGVPSDADFFNNITAWFEIMFKPKYPGVRPSMIYYQGTNRNIVVEVPDNIDIEPYLGAHYWKDFLVAPYCFNVAQRASYVYEYDWKNHLIPPLQGGWSPEAAKYGKIRENFDVRDPYPLPPRPAPNSTLRFAKKLPPGRVLAPGQDPFPPLPELPPLPPLPPIPALVPQLPTGLVRGGALDQGGRGEGSVNRDLVDGSEALNRSTVSPLRGQSEMLNGNIRGTSSDPRRRPHPHSHPNAQSTSSRESQERERDISTTSDPLNPNQLQTHTRPGHLEEAEALLSSLLPSLSPLPALNSNSSNTRQSTRDPLPKSSSMPPPPLPSSSSSSKMKLGKKMDPYEEEELAFAFLRCPSSTITSPPPSSTRSSTVTATATSDTPSRATSIKSEIEVKQELLGDEYTPSRELQDAFTGLTRSSTAVSERVEGDDEDQGEEEEKYKPSEEWAQAFSSLQVEMQGHSDNPYTPSESLLEALSSLPNGMLDLSSTHSKELPSPRYNSGRVRVKDEPTDDDTLPPRSSPVRVKREPASPELGVKAVKRVKLEP
ncbi:hypothetical protein AN958_02342 [Leucoagaricus sp. SymC.cos]|nr:hypothetical protein AN958_02342 [Leucoagaricus sp. SymC.cos]